MALVWGIVPCGAQPAPTPVFIPNHANGIYEVGEPAGWAVTLPDGVSAPVGKYTYTIKRNQLDTLKTGEFDLSSGKATIEVPSDAPAMMNVQVTPPPAAPPPAAAPATPAGTATASAPGSAPVASAPAVAGPGGPAGAGGRGGRGGRGRGRGGPNYALQLGAAIAPTKLQPSAPRPADFDAFWDGKLKALAAVPMNPQLAPQETNVAGVELAMFKIDSLNSQVQGYVAKPAKEGKFPALLLYQYAGVYVIPTTNSTNRAAQGWLCLNVDSHDVTPDSTQGVPQNYQSVGNGDREQSYFLDMYLRDTRAVQYLKSRPDWDGKTIVLMGTSMGGQQTLVTAGLNDGITAALAWVPSGTDFDGDLHGRKLGYPNWSTRDPKVAATGLYFDVVNFASRIKAPTFIGLGFLDTTASPVGIWTAYNQIPGAKEAIAMPQAAHNNQAPPATERAWTTRSEEILSAILKGGEFKANGIPAHQ
jgi:cephalosporin-C deacetylase-like acetyl esterase